MNLSKIKSVESYRERGQVVIVRVDYNIGQEFYDLLKKVFTGNNHHPVPSFIDWRIQSSLATIKHLLSLQSKIIVLAHQGRPQPGEDNKDLRLLPQARYLASLLKVKFIDLGDKFKLSPYPVKHFYFYSGDLRKLNREQINSLNPGDILFFENIRFYKEEDTGDEKFAQNLAELSDVYVNEAFSVSHRQSVSVSVLPTHLPHFAGINLIKELQMLGRLDRANSPYVVVLGGAKLTDKVNMLKHLLTQADQVLVGGAMANLFLELKGYPIGDSYIEAEGRAPAKELWRNFKHKIVLPKDVVIGREQNLPEVRELSAVGEGEKILDIGPQTILEFSKSIKAAHTIVWNGPLGLFENKKFAHGTLALGRLIALQGKGRAFVVAGGGDTIEAIRQINLSEYFDFISTGGGAMLSFLGKESLPGLEILNT